MDSTHRGRMVPLFAGLAVGAHLWMSRAMLLTRETTDGVLDRLFISTDLRSLVLGVVVGPIMLYAAHGIVRHIASRFGATNPQLFAPADTAWMRPLFLFWVSAFVPFSAIPATSRVFSIATYFLVDLRWWWTSVVVAFTAAQIYRKVCGWKRGREPFSQLGDEKGSRPLFRFLPEASLVALCAVWVIAGTPYLRFSATTGGDEPKYLRHCENLYQGHGLEISSLRPIAELPADFEPQLGRNFVHVRHILPREINDLRADARIFLSDPSHRFTRSTKTRGFLKGKTGGVYQVHQPGLSALMLPAYAIDRQLSAPAPGSKAQWPERLVAVNAFFLALYLTSVVLTFRLARRLVPAQWMAWVASLTLGMTLPIAAFAFQIYPETAGGVLLIAIAGHLLFPARDTPAVALAVGLLTGYLPWLHVRFSALAAVLFVTAAVNMRHNGRRLAAFAIGVAAPAILLGLYAYRLTGSILPTAIWNEADGDVTLSATGALRGSVAYLIDSQWGLFAHSPILMLVLPGYYWLFRQHRQAAWLCALATLSVLLPSAAHTLHGAATTPSRLIVAVLPLAALPIAVCIARYWRSRWFQALAVILLMVSLENALTYNWWHVKNVGRMLDTSYSGWKVNLLFPAQSRAPWRVSTANGWLYVAWVAVLFGAAFGPALLSRRRSAVVPVGGATNDVKRGPLLAVTGGLILLGTIIAAATGSWERDDYRGPRTDTALRAANAIDEADACLLCLSSATGRMGTDEARTAIRQMAPHP